MTLISTPRRYRPEHVCVEYMPLCLHCDGDSEPHGSVPDLLHDGFLLGVCGL